MPPVVGNFSPVVTSAVGLTDTIAFDVTDSVNPFRRISVLVQFPNLKIYDVAYDGSAFGNRYRSQFNSKVPITNGFRFTLLREEGWPSSPRIVPIAISTVGDENPVESQTYAWTLT
jgi:hypothetical protein